MLKVLKTIIEVLKSDNELEYLKEKCEDAFKELNWRKLL
jgi:hypothetical protein